MRAATSTSTIAPASEGPPVPVRLKPSGLMARVVPEPCAIPLADGRTLTARPGDWRIFRGDLTVDVVSPARFAAEYEPVRQGGLELPQAACDQLEGTLGLGATRAVPVLLAAVERLASVRIGDIRIPFTPGQLAELSHRAQKRGRTVEAELRAVVARIEDDLFYKGG
jgi:hypothetical protein